MPNNRFLETLNFFASLATALLLCRQIVRDGFKDYFRAVEICYRLRRRRRRRRQRLLSLSGSAKIVSKDVERLPERPTLHPDK
jgi:hypothetical protein